VGALLFFITILGSLSLGWSAINYPTPVDSAELSQAPYFYTGLVRSASGSGSGSVAVHPNLVLGCAHVNYTDANTWRPAGSIEWFWRWNQGAYPLANRGQYLTGYYYFTSYQANAGKYGKADARTFADDFVANYSATLFTAGGYAAGWVEDGKKYLTTGGRSKIITGYPAGLYSWYPSHPDEYRMHATTFNTNMKATKETYLQLNGLQAGKGNSGGPVWVWGGDNWALAGVYVSGLGFPESIWPSIGVCCLNKKWWTLILAALDKTGGAGDLFTKTVSLANVPLAIPDKGSAVRTFTVSGLVGGVKTINLSLVAPHQRRGDLIVTLRSPTGKTVALTTAVTVAKSSPPNLTLSSKVVSGFSGLLPNGLWTLTVKDSYRNNTGSLQSASIQITTR